jgi:hypothetical protein
MDATGRDQATAKYDSAKLANRTIDPFAPECRMLLFHAAFSFREAHSRFIAFQCQT